MITGREEKPGAVLSTTIFVRLLCGKNYCQGNTAHRHNYYRVLMLATGNNAGMLFRGKHFDFSFASRVMPASPQVLTLRASARN